MRESGRKRRGGDRDGRKQRISWSTGQTHTHSHTHCYTRSPHTKFMSGIYCFLGLAELKDGFIDLFVCTFEAFSIIKMSSKAVRGEASALKCQKM